MKYISRLLGTLAFFGVVSACSPADESGPPAVTDEEATVASAVEAMVTSSFLFQDPLIGQTYTQPCSFNTTSCYVAGQHHTGIDDSATTTTPIRASNFGIRTLRQDMSSGDHGMGNAVILQHLLVDGTFIYASDNHMSSHGLLSGRPDGQVVVPRGAKVGQVGGSGYGSPTYWGYHDHHEMKTGNVLYNPCGSGTYYGYTPTSAVDYCYRNPADYLGKKAVLVPEFDPTNATWGDYDGVYGVANAPVFARITIQGSTTTFARAGIGGRVGWSTGIADFPMATNLAPGSWSLTGNRTFTAGDYRFFAAVQVGTDWRLGYPVVFTIVDKAADFIRDNDQASAYFQNGGLGTARFDGYLYGAFAATGDSGAWARWYTQRAGAYSVWAYIGGSGNGWARFKIYPSGSGTPVYTDPVNMGAARYGWVRLTASGTASWSFTTAGYVGLSADAGSASDVYLFDAIKFIAL